jgi:peroxiredoxin
MDSTNKSNFAVGHVCLLAMLFALTVVACSPAEGPEAVSEKQAWNGESWRAEIQLPDAVLPVGLHVARNGQTAWFSNGIERVEVGEVSIEGNHYWLRFPAFNNHLELQRNGDLLSGTLTLVKRGYEQHLPVVAEPDPGYRFTPDPDPKTDITGRWEVVFTDEEGNQGFGIGEFDQQGGDLAGTFLTATGDYRYLAGDVDGRAMRLSTFDGAHAFVFTATLDEFGALHGDFWSGSSWHETWVARRNFEARLPDAFTLTSLKPGFDSLEFTFPDLTGEAVSLSDPAFAGKVVLVTLGGSWCPNCADETEFLADYFLENRDRGLEIISLLFEHVREFEHAAGQGRELIRKHGIEYEVLIAGYSDKTEAADALPMLDRVVAYPTMIFIDRMGKVRGIHTGFSGPGTGGHYLEFVREFNALMDELLAEPVP